MAKDKGKKSTDDAFAKPSEAPAGGDGFKFASDENDGELFLITPLREHEIPDTYSKTPGATKTVIVADIVALNTKKPEKSEEHEEAWIFGGWLMGAVRGYIGERKVLGRLRKEKDKKSATGYVWKLEDADDDDIAVAKAYLDSVDAFAIKGGKAKKSKAEPEPAAKKKAKKK